MLLVDAIQRVRDELNDNGTTPRWSTAEIERWLNDGETNVIAMRPDLMLSGFTIVSPVTLDSTANPTQLLNVPDRVAMSVVSYAISRCFSKDADNAANAAQSAYWMTQYAQELSK